MIIIIIYTYIKYIGLDFSSCITEVDEHQITVQLWDTAGQERYRSMVTAYYQQAHGIIMVYDISNRESFDNLKIWTEMVETKCNDEIKVLLIGNKLDLDSIREVSTKEGKQYAENNNFFYMETSAKENLKNEVGEAFEMIITFLSRKEIIKIENQPIKQTLKPVYIPVENIEIKKTNCC